jgi:hypothetical protein
MNAGIIVGGFDPFDLVDGNKRVFRPVWNQQAFGVRLHIERRTVDVLEKAIELRLYSERRVCRDSLFHPGNSGLQPFGVDGFDEIVQRVNVECPDRVDVVGRDEDSERHMHYTHSFHYLEAGIPRHLNVEKDKIDRLCLQKGNNLVTISTFFNDLNIRMDSQELAQSLTRLGSVWRLAPAW